MELRAPAHEKKRKRHLEFQKLCFLKKRKSQSSLYLESLFRQRAFLGGCSSSVIRNGWSQRSEMGNVYKMDNYYNQQLRLSHSVGQLC